MTDLVFAARSLVESNLGWFLETRRTLGEAAGNERAININKDVLAEWFPAGVPSSQKDIPIRSRYLDGRFGFEEKIVSDSRTIRNQGGGKNWRLAGDGIPGARYDVRVGDLLFMVFDKSTTALSWMVVRSNSDPSRNVPSNESNLHADMLAALGPPSGSMWLLDPSEAPKIINAIARVFPIAGELLMSQKAMFEAWSSSLADAGFIVDKELEWRLPLALQTKRFAILTGLSGSGKTLLARLFARWISSSDQYYEVVAVGSNWTSNENIIGYPDALDSSRYEKTRALELILRANLDPLKPYFLILDEMNLSHVERYFADFLSAIESPDEPIRLHGDQIARGDVPPRLSGGLPKNLFVIGTVNVDETTYMFSPKVLDRANVLEFRTNEAAISSFLVNPVKVDEGVLQSKGSDFSEYFVASANGSIEMEPERRAIVASELNLLFRILMAHGMEFGFRTAFEMTRYIALRTSINPNLSWTEAKHTIQTALDEQVCQKILPKLHGSRKQIEPALLDLSIFCSSSREWFETGGADHSKLLQTLSEPVEVRELGDIEQPTLPLSSEKISRLMKKLNQNGFASFAEA